MKFYHYLLVLTLVLGSCKSTKNATDKNSATTYSSAKKIVKKHINANFDAKTVDAKLKVNYSGERESLGFSVKMKIKKDEEIWLKGTKLITIFKAKITPEKVSFYSPYKKNYFEGDFSMLKELLGFEVDFYQLQNMLLGQAILDLKAQKQEVSTYNNSKLQLSPKKQNELFDIFYVINTNHFKLDKQYLVNTSKNQRLDIDYPAYKEENSILFPKNINILAKENNKATAIKMDVKSVIFNSELSTPYKIPAGYKEIQFNK